MLMSAWKEGARPAPAPRTPDSQLRPRSTCPGGRPGMRCARRAHGPPGGDDDPDDPDLPAEPRLTSSRRARRLTVGQRGALSVHDEGGALPAPQDPKRRERGRLHMSQQWRVVWSQARTITRENTGSEAEAEAMLGRACALAVEQHASRGSD